MSFSLIAKARGKFVWHFLVLAACLPLLVVGAAFADEAPPGAKEDEPARRERSAIDDELLKDLGPDPLAAELDGDMPADKTESDKQKTKESSPKKPEASGDALDQELLKGLGEGEDLGEKGAGDDPLARLIREMRDVENLIARRQADEDTVARQEKIVRQINELIRQAQKQRQSGGQSSSAGTSGKGAQQTAKSRESSQPERRMAPSNDTAESPAQQSSKKTRKQSPERPDMADMREVLKGVWGQLPERQREQMLQSYEEQFLPKYEQMIADYFRSLTEEEPRKP
jgi:hypothetical protein